MGRHAIVLLTPAIAMALLLTVASPIASAQEAGAPPDPEPCGFLDGFRTLRDQVGHDLVGECLEHSRPTEGGVAQRTTGGLLVWDELLNLVSFTNGHRTWVSGPNGIEVRPNDARFAWEEDAIAAAESKAAERAAALRGPSPQQLALIYVERVRGNNDVSLEKIYLTAYYQAHHLVGQKLAELRAAGGAALREAWTRAVYVAFTHVQAQRNASTSPS